MTNTTAPTVNFSGFEGDLTSDERQAIRCWAADQDWSRPAVDLSDDFEQLLSVLGVPSDLDADLIDTVILPNLA